MIIFTKIILYIRLYEIVSHHLHLYIYIQVQIHRNNICTIGCMICIYHQKLFITAK